LFLPCYSSAETTAATQTTRTALMSGIFRKAVKKGILTKMNADDLAESEVMAETDAAAETDPLIEEQTEQWELTTWLKWS